MYRLARHIAKNEPRFGKLNNKKSLVERKSPDHLQQQSDQPSSAATPQWLLILGSFVGVFAAFALMQRLFPRRVNIVHKDENGNVIGSYRRPE